MNEVKLRLAIRDLYRGDGGPLNDLDQGWNDGVDAAAEIFSAEIDALRAEGRELKRLRKLVVDGARPLEKDAATKWMADMDREATRIQQARKK